MRKLVTQLDQSLDCFGIAIVIQVDTGCIFPALFCVDQNLILTLVEVRVFMYTPTPLLYLLQCPLGWPFSPSLCSVTIPDAAQPSVSILPPSCSHFIAKPLPPALLYETSNAPPPLLLLA